MAYASLLAGMAFNNGNLGYVHAMAHQLGGLYDMPHGGPCHNQKSSILPLHYTILLRCVGRGELMLDALLFKKSFNLRVVKLRSIVASNLFDSQSELIFSPSQESL